MGEGDDEFIKYYRECIELQSVLTSLTKIIIIIQHL